MKIANKTKVTIKIVFITLIICVLALLVLGNKFIFGGSDNEDKGTLVVNSVKTICQLATTEYDYTYVDEFSDDSEVDLFITKLTVPLTNKYFVGSFNGTIKYGVDLNKVESSDIVVDEENKKITISMPEVIMVGHSTEKTKFYAESNNLLNAFTPEDGENFKEEHKKDAEQQAIDNGIIERVQKDTRKVVKISLHNIDTFKDYEIDCKFPEQTEIKEDKLSFDIDEDL